MQTTSVLLGRARNEALHLLEWVAYHRLIGFDEIVVASNPSIDGTGAVLDQLADLQMLHHLEYELGPNETPDREMGKALIDLGCSLERDWLCMLDIDEFLYFENGKNVDAFLSGFPDVDGIAINWATFGSAGQREPDGRLTMERFVYRACLQDPLNRWVKSFGRSAAVTGGGPHYFFLKEGSRPVVHCNGKPFTDYKDMNAIDHSVARINHYAIRSLAEYRMKNLRGDGNVPLRQQAEINRYNAAFFQERDRNDIYDDAMLTFVAPVLAQVEEWRRIPAIGDALRLAERRLLQTAD